MINMDQQRFWIVFLLIGVTHLLKAQKMEGQFIYKVETVIELENIEKPNRSLVGFDDAALTLGANTIFVGDVIVGAFNSNNKTFSSLKEDAIISFTDILHGVVMTSHHDIILRGPTGKIGSNQDLNILGDLVVQGSYTSQRTEFNLENLIIEPSATLMFQYSQTRDIFIQGSVINNGVIGGRIGLNIAQDIINNGELPSDTNTVFFGDAIHTVSGLQDVQVVLANNSIFADGDISFGILSPQGNRFDFENHGTLTLHTLLGQNQETFMTNGDIILFRDPAVNYTYHYPVNFFENIHARRLIINGTIQFFLGFHFHGDLIIDEGATLQSYSSFNNQDVFIHGNTINKGIVGISQDMMFLGDIDNQGTWSANINKSYIAWDGNDDEIFELQFSESGTDFGDSIVVNALRYNGIVFDTNIPQVVADKELVFWRVRLQGSNEWSEVRSINSELYLDPDPEFFVAPEIIDHELGTSINLNLLAKNSTYTGPISLNIEGNTVIPDTITMTDGVADTALTIGATGDDVQIIFSAEDGLLSSTTNSFNVTESVVVPEPAIETATNSSSSSSSRKTATTLTSIVKKFLGIDEGEDRDPSEIETTLSTVPELEVTAPAELENNTSEDISAADEAVPIVLQSSCLDIDSTFPVLYLGNRVELKKTVEEKDNVRKLQSFLNTYGYSAGTVDGDFGAKTASAITDFQSDNGLTSDGIFGPTSARYVDDNCGNIKSKATIQPTEPEPEKPTSTQTTEPEPERKNVFEKITNTISNWFNGVWVKITETLFEGNQEEAQKQKNELISAVIEKEKIDSEIKIVSYDSPYFVGKKLEFEETFLPSIKKFEQFAAESNIKLHVTSTGIRNPDAPIDGKIVEVASFSNHFVGHAIDVNFIGSDGSFCNSGCLEDALQHESINNFINLVRADSLLRWGGDFNDADVVHLDASLNIRDKARWLFIYKKIHEK